MLSKCTPNAFWFRMSYDEFLFHAEDHRYEFNGEVLEPVTSLVKSYSRPFDEITLAAKTAANKGVSVESVLQQWKVTRNTAAYQGSFVHREIENVIRRCIITDELVCKFDYPDKYMPKMKAAWQWIIDHIEVIGGWMELEVPIAYPEVRLAGTVDLIASNYQGIPSIIDWKTNKEIDVIGFKNMLPPFTRGKLALPDSSYYHYALQLNLYRRILAKRYEYEAEKLVIVHLEDSGRYTEYDVPILDNHVDAILKGRERDELQELAGG